MVKETRPLRVVTNANLMQGRGSFLGPDTWRRTHWWELTLECGHWQERSVTYGPLLPGEHPRGRHNVNPAPKRSRCDQCGYDLRAAARHARD